MEMWCEFWKSGASFWKIGASYKKHGASTWKCGASFGINKLAQLFQKLLFSAQFQKILSRWC